MKPKHQSDVLIVGAGPVGLCAALGLAEQGVEVQVVDRDWIGSAHSYALALHPDSLSLLDGLGVADELLAIGHRVGRIGFYEGETLRAAIDLGELGGRFPFVLVLPQSKLEGALEERLNDRQCKVLWNHQLLSLGQDEGAVRCEIGRLDRVSLGYPIARTEWIVDKRFDARASFAIGADGYHSFTRRSLEARFEDYGGTESFAVFEFRSSLETGDEMRVVFHGDTVNVLWPMADGRARWSFQIDDDGADAAQSPALDTLLRARAPWYPAPREVFWSTRTRFERRLADPFGRGRIWLAGDAGHVTGPVGSQSMNVGLREAHELGERIVAVLRQKGDPKLLERYGEERRAEWRKLLGREPGPQAGSDAPAWVREHASRLLPCVPASGDALGRLLAQLGIAWS